MQIVTHHPINFLVFLGFRPYDNLGNNLELDSQENDIKGMVYK